MSVESAPWKVGTIEPSATSAKPQITWVTPFGSRSHPATSLCQKTTVRSLAATVGQSPVEDDDEDDASDDAAELAAVAVDALEPLPLPLASDEVLASSLLLPARTVTTTTVMTTTSTTTARSS